MSKKNKKLLMLAGVSFLCLAMIFVTGMLFLQDNNIGAYDQTLEVSSYNRSKGSIDLSVLETGLDTSNIENIYTKELQSEIYDQITSLKDEKEYDLDDMLAIMNPYYTNTTGLYLYFKTQDSLQVTYTISTYNTKDFTRTLDPDTATGFTKEHEYQLIGLVPGVENIVLLDLFNEEGALIHTKEFTVIAPELSSKEEYQRLEVFKGNSKSKVSEGLYTVLGNDTLESDNLDCLYLYDNEGVIRMEMRIISYRPHRLLFDDEYMYLSISPFKIAAVDKLGQVQRVYETGDYSLHHDYIYNKEGNLWVLATKSDSDTQQDYVIEIDLKSGEVDEILDLADVLGDYKATAIVPEGKDNLDWMHINSIQLMDTDSMLLSSRETSTIIKVRDINSKPKLEYLIGFDEYWEESGYDSYVFQPEGDFTLHAGQHSLEYVPDKELEEGQYYLHLYNNNNTLSTTRPDFRWKSYDKYYGSGTAKEGDQSYYYKYLVDEVAKTYSFISSIEVDYSGYVSSVQTYKGNLIIDSGSTFAIYEYDSDHKLIQKLIGTGENWYYRVYKYDYNGYWFLT